MSDEGFKSAVTFLLIFIAITIGFLRWDAAQIVRAVEKVERAR